jgi:hypothetical protein
VVSRKGKIAAEIFDQLALRLVAVAASAWMFNACGDLDGLSPVQAIKAGRQDDVRACSAALLQQCPGPAPRGRSRPPELTRCRKGAESAAANTGIGWN